MDNNFLGIEYTTSQLIFISISCISLVFLQVVFIAFCCEKELKTYSFTQVIYLSISTFLSTSSYLINYSQGKYDEDNLLCRTQGFLMIWFDLSLYVWATLINYSVYYHIKYFEEIQPDKTPINWRIGDVILGYVFPFAYSTLLLSFNLIGPNNDYCWIMEDKKFPGNISPIIVTYSIAWFCLAINLFFTAWVVCYICRLPKEEKDYVKNFAKKLLSFPIIQFILTLPGSISRIMKFMDISYEILNNISLWAFASMGIFVALAFGKNLTIIKRIRQRCCCCCRKRNVVVTQSNDDLIDENDDLPLYDNNLHKESILEQLPESYGSYGDY